MSGTRQGNPPPPASPPEVMTIDELAAYLQVSKSSLYKLAQDGKVPGQKVGRHWRFRRETIDRWLDESRGGKV
ncbi:MAG: DNA-binding protein [Leptolyngbya sp. PLA3]|nr:MAG: DNA-binding protein [Cyanobacteria bacterium CYA]MCE7968343.1 DNA-binding protein [Leptolyngbya sp. PL-A3]